MSDQSSPRTLIEDLEAIRKSLDKIAESKTEIPTLEEIVGHRAPTTVNPSNPFLSSSSLSELIKIRNEAEARAAQELADMAPVKSIEEILAEPPKAPDPEVIIEQMEAMFDSWVENSVSQYMEIFESELRNRLQQDFRELVGQWYIEHELPLPKSFEHRQDPAVESEEEPQAKPDSGE
ncbi:MAG: hypothetical protein R3309_15220 [Reinekea sp.]|jgi:hypothetical protein|nr:hypothetical protein [Reinekea sp.]MDX1475522.1 hypothetical protein [Reinekea sp.]